MLFNWDEMHIIHNICKIVSWLAYGIACILSYNVASGSEITPCNKIDKPLVV